jgi:phosphomannomutase/phosphoglucomutase
VALLAAIASAWLTWEMGSGGRTASAQDQFASELASWLGGALSAEAGQLRAAVERETLAAELTRGDTDGLTAAGRRLAASRPGTLGLWVLPVGKAEADYSSRPPLTYASANLIRRSESEGRAPPLEAQLMGSADAQVVVPVRVVDAGGTLRGHVLFSLRPTIVQELLDSAPWTRGYAEVIQPTEGQDGVVVARRGTPGGLAPVVRHLPGTGWKVRYQAPEGRAKGTAEIPWVLLAAGLLAAALAAGGLLWWRHRSAAPRPGEPVAVPAGTAAPAAGEDEFLGAPPLPDVEEISSVEPPAPAPEPVAEGPGLPPASIFLAYDIRGIVGETLTVEHARAIGRAVGSEAYDRGQQALVVGRDGRLSSPELAEALIAGLVESGRDVIDIGQVPTPVLYFAGDYLDTHSGVMVTGSHNPPEYNGFKVFLGDEALAEQAVAALRNRLATGNLVTGSGTVQSLDMSAEYIRRVTEDIPTSMGNAYSLVIDCGNGVAGDIAPRLYRALGHDVIELHCTVDGNFPGHAPDPTQPENLQDLAQTVRERQADLGLAFDGDGDRLVMVDSYGLVIWPDRLLMLLASDILARNPGGKLVYDVKCSAKLARLAESLGGEPVLSRSGHSLVKARMRETGAVLGGEGSGHIYIRDRWYGFDDALYAGARVLEVLRGREGSPTAVFGKLPIGKATPEIRVPMAPADAVALVQRLSAVTPFPDAIVTTVDGLRADYPDRWGLVRASNTTPALVLRFEGDDEAALSRIQGEFRRALLAVEPTLTLPF